MSEVNKTQVEYWMQRERFRVFSNNTFHFSHNPWGDLIDVNQQMEKFVEALIEFLQPYPTFVERIVLRDNKISCYQDEVRWIFADHIAIAKGDFERWLTELKQKAKEFEERWNS